MAKRSIVAAIGLASALLSAQALAVPFTAQFPSSGSTIVASTGFLDLDEVGYFWSSSRGDSVTETFMGTGLPSVNSLGLSLEITQNVLSSGAQVDWDVLVNAIVVGNWSWADGDGTGALDLSFAFPDIVGGGTYTIAMVVTNDVPGGLGSIALAANIQTSTVTLNSVPEPGTVALLGLALAGFAFARRRG